MMQVKKAKKLLPNDAKIMDIAKGRSKRLSNVRNVPRQGGFGAGQPYQKPKAGIPSEMILEHAAICHTYRAHSRDQTATLALH